MGMHVLVKFELLSSNTFELLQKSNGGGVSPRINWAKEFKKKILNSNFYILGLIDIWTDRYSDIYIQIYKHIDIQRNDRKKDR